MEYQDVNAKAIDLWCETGWEWGKAFSHETYEKALCGQWNIYLTPTKTVPNEWFGGQLEAGFVLTHLYEDTNGLGNLHEHNIPTFLATRVIKR